MVPQSETSTVKHGGGSVMVWGCSTGSRVGDLYIVRGTLNQNGYHSIQQHHIVPSGMFLVGQGFILREDNDPKYQSPDSKELVWDELDRRVKAKQSTSATHLWELLQQNWEDFSEEYLISIVRRMRRVCSAVILPKEQGGVSAEPAPQNKLPVLKKQADDVMNIIKNNLENKLKGQLMADNLLTKSQELEKAARNLDRTTKKVENSYRWKNIKLIIFIVVIVLIIVLIIVLLATGVILVSAPMPPIVTPTIKP